ncbi:MAG: hypothetical protein PHN59_04550 [Candidatus Omnitrophica bacterium]|nr:hypothetical protein [Candidatus Omnitrophota bacterium]
MISGPVRAEHTRYGPPFICDDAGTEPKGGWEFAGWIPLATLDSGNYYLTQYQLALTYGVTDRLEVYAAPFVYKRFGGEKQARKEDMFADVWLGAKYQIIKTKDFFLTGKFSIKDGSRSAFKDSAYLSNGADEYKITLIGSKYLGLLQIDANLGYDILGNRPTRRAYSNEVSYNLSLTHPITRGMLIVGEFAGKTDNTRTSTTFRNNILDAYLGLKWWVVKDKVGGKVAVGKRLTEYNPDLLLALGFVAYF